MHSQQPARIRDALHIFLDTSLDQILNRHQTSDPQAAALALFHSVAAEVPAYQAFLAEHGIVPEQIQSAADFQQLPQVSKASYITRYPLPQRCRGGQLSASDFVAFSSGSTGKPTVWPRFQADELPVAARFEQIFHDSFQSDRRSTLAVICFALGTWVGGMYTASCCRHLAAKGYPITVATPGSNKAEILRVVAELGPHYEQVVLLGYPPFLKDVIDTGRAQGLDWAPYQIKTVTAGEVFSEEWRTLVGERAGMSDVRFDSASLYGTADAGVLANETPLSISIRRFLAATPAAARALFGEARLPTLCQYDPLTRFFEADQRSLVFSGENGVPLVRYSILDTGGVVAYDEMLSFVRGYGFDPVADLGPEARGIRPLPFVFVFGRSDFTISYFGANIYPENVTVGLEQPGITAWVTGKFVLEVREDSDRNRVLAVVVELAPGEQASPERRELLADSIRRELLRLNSEFGAYVPVASQTPLVELAAAGDPHWFPAGVKHRYTRR